MDLGGVVARGAAHLARDVDELQCQFKAFQADLKKRLITVQQDLGNRLAELETRMATAEHERHNSASHNQMAFESISNRVQVLAVEMTEYPDGPDMRVALQRLDSLVAFSDQHAARLQSLCEQVHHEREKDRNTISFQLEEVRNLCCCVEDKMMLRLESLLCDEPEEHSDPVIDEYSQTSVGNHHQHVRDTALLMSATKSVAVGACGDPAMDQSSQTSVGSQHHDDRDIALPMAATKSVEIVPDDRFRKLDSHSERFRKLDSQRESLLSRVKMAEQQLDALVKTKADRIELSQKADLRHTHDRLVSADGTVSFAV